MVNRFATSRLVEITLLISKYRYRVHCVLTKGYQTVNAGECWPLTVPRWWGGVAARSGTAWAAARGHRISSPDRDHDRYEYVYETICTIRSSWWPLFHPSPGTGTTVPYASVSLIRHFKMFLLTENAKNSLLRTTWMYESDRLYALAPPSQWKMYSVFVPTNLTKVLPHSFPEVAAFAGNWT
jgi:hypothetical protein